MTTTEPIESPPAEPVTAEIPPRRRHIIPIQIGYGLVNIVADAALLAVSMFLAFAMRFQLEWFGEVQELHSLEDYLPLMGVQVFLISGILLIGGGYVFRRRISRVDELQRIFVAVSIGTIGTLAISSFFEREFFFSRSVILAAWALSIVMIVGFRVAVSLTLAGILRRGVAPQRVLIVGSGEMARVIVQKIEAAPGLGYEVVGFVSNGAMGNDQTIMDWPVLGVADEIDALIDAHNVNELIIGDPSLSHQRIMDLVSRCSGKSVDIKVFPDVFQIMSSGVKVGDLNGLPMLYMRDAALRGYNLAVKRTVDVVLSLVVLIFFSWLLLLIAVLVKLSDPRGPVFYVQERIGLNGESFPTLKFRSMYIGAEAQSGPVWTKRGDPRITPVGRLLRRFSLDELPQFVNILLGHMTVVGPRPERPHFVKEFSQRMARYRERHSEKTGLTGWAQINGLRGNVSIEERTAYDLWYVENWTLGLDFKIMLRTIGAIFRDQNAY